MAEYYPLLERAVAALGSTSPEARHAIYARAREALLNQLRGMDPPISEEDIGRESEALDAAISRLEAKLKADAAKSPPTLPAPSPAPQRAAAPPVPPPARDRPSIAPRPRPDQDGRAAPDVRAGTPARPRLGTDPGQTRPTMTAGSRLSAAPRPPAPMMRPPRAAAPGPAAMPTGASVAPGVVTPEVATPGSAAPEPESRSGSEKPGTTADTGRRPEGDGLPAGRDDGGGGAALPAAPTLGMVSRSGTPDTEGRKATGDVPPTVPPADRDGRLRPAAPTAASAEPRRYSVYALIAVALLIIAGVAVAAYRLRDRPEQLTAANSPVASVPVVAAPVPAKISGRAEDASPVADGGSTGAATPGNETTQPSTGTSNEAAPEAAGDAVPAATPEIGVAQRAALLVDAPQDPQRVKTYVGTVVWKPEAISPGQAQSLATAVQADVDIPDAKLAMSMVLKKNTEPQFPASHTLEFHFVAKDGNTLGPVKQINVPEMRRDDGAQVGEALVGVPVTITENYFLVGLSRGSPEAQNLAKLQQRNWLDVSLLFASGKVAKITFEKGAAGERILDDAIKTWQ